MAASPPDRVITGRTIVRPWTVADAEHLHEAIVTSTEHLRPWMPWIAFEPKSPADRAALIEDWTGQWERAEDFTYGILGLDDATVLGGTGLHRRLGDGLLEIGYWVHVDHVGQGLATEVATALTTAAASVDGVERVVIRHDRANAASGAIPRKLGYAFVGETVVDITSPGESGIQLRWERPAGTPR
jgi:ribosomal-protein-serine acetyltransferase